MQIIRNTLKFYSLIIRANGGVMVNDKLRMLIVGAGFMGETHLEAVSGLEHVEFTAVVDRDAAKADAFAEKFGLTPFDSLDKAIDIAAPDAVDICTPTTTHLPIIRTCADHELHCLCEKPVALTLEDARAIKALDSSYSRIMVAQVLRFWPEYQYAVKAVAEKQFGDLVGVDCKRFCSPPDWNDWMMRPDGGGGAVIDLQIHDLDFILNLLGAPKTISSKGAVTNGAVNTVYNTLDYDNGAAVWSEGSMIAPVSYPFRMWYKIVCSDAVLEFDFWRPKGERLMVCPVNGDKFHPELPKHDAYGEEISYFARQILDNAPFDLCPLASSVTALEMCYASNESVRSGAPVAFGE